MSVRVNLLPREFEERSRTRRAVALAVLAVLAWTALLVALLLGRLGTVETARDERDAAQAEVNRLQAEVDALTAFQQLAAQVAAGEEVLATAMGNEVSWAQVLNDVALTVPTTTSLTTLQAGLLDLQPGAVGGDVFVQSEQGDIGVLAVQGYSIEDYSPGVEAVLLRFGEVETFFQQFLSTAATDEIGDVPVTTFTAEVRLGSDLRTGRYADGLPEVGQ